MTFIINEKLQLLFINFTLVFLISKLYLCLYKCNIDYTNKKMT